ncbi:hypothetical protein [Actinomyces bowdenii]|uniref:Uncharacterized protein n=1 Tax=Actinomyces bowdenii TaxID=131109 RepID=A0A853EMT9_9ACTO|nr:hypothetical protein [Actinomyces bowdenii]MBF0698377.1 hypothetical protein [Actinomyces bowdenii]MDO5064811.1 hypothetical protein [Actinomyces bowdenii]NYS70549.1 hypothetical protein [Actinomyces bowdenii]
MAATVPTDRTRVRVFTDDELRQRLQEVTEKLSQRFGSIDRALDREQDWDYDDEESALFSEYHAVKFLLDD